MEMSEQAVDKLLAAFADAQLADMSTDEPAMRRLVERSYPRSRAEAGDAAKFRELVQLILRDAVLILRFLGRLRKAPMSLSEVVAFGRELGEDNFAARLVELRNREAIEVIDKRFTLSERGEVLLKDFEELFRRSFAPSE